MTSLTQSLQGDYASSIIKQNSDPKGNFKKKKKWKWDRGRKAGDELELSSKFQANITDTEVRTSKGTFQRFHLHQPKFADSFLSCLDATYVHLKHMSCRQAQYHVWKVISMGKD